jgi:glycosyltransferase involved in cell wall biosynthesis
MPAHCSGTNITKGQRLTISIITPTADQPTGIALLEKYVSRQTVQPDQWIVADDGTVPATLTLGQEHIIRARKQEGGASLGGNVLAGMEAATGDVIIILEHDDWYAANHIELCVEKLKTAQVCGAVWQRYYNVEFQASIVMRNIGSSLCNTAFRKSLSDRMRRAAGKAINARAIGLDRMFWDDVIRTLLPHDIAIHDRNTVVGIKGLPGRKGLGMGHNPQAGSRRWDYDKDFTQLRAWIGSDADLYKNLVRK